jgi:hypothetical protein
MGVPTATDSSINYLLPALAQPLVQMIVDASTIGCATLNFLVHTGTEHIVVIVLTRF